MSKNNEKKLVPKLRFPEFLKKSDWDKKALKNVSEVTMGSSPSSKSYNENKIGLPLLQGNADIKNRLSAPRIYTSQITKECQIDDVLLSVRAPVGTVAKSLHNACIGRGIAAIRAIDKNSQEYLYQWLISNESAWQNISQGGTFDAVNSDDVRNLLLPIPLPQEQQKIAACLSSLDEVITAESQKLKLLQDNKKGLLQNLLPQEGETFPKFRFKEFEDSGDWEETTLTQVGDYENGKAHEQDIADDGEFIVVNSKFISQDGEVKKFTNTAFCPATKGDVLMVLSDIPNGKAIAKCFLVEENNRYTVNQRICRITPRNVNSKILYYLLNRNPYFLAFDDGVKQTNLRKDDVLNCPLLIPEDPKEQEEIAGTLSSVDELITAQGQKLEALQLHKKGLLQGLFPTINNEA
jgi:type I restriction enzyme S subunit